MAKDFSVISVLLNASEHCCATFSLSCTIRYVTGALHATLRPLFMAKIQTWICRVSCRLKGPKIFDPKTS
jgi:hypothetical protein